MNTGTYQDTIASQTLREETTSFVDMADALQATIPDGKYDGVHITRDLGMFRWDGGYVQHERVIGYRGSPPSYGPGLSVWVLNPETGTVRFAIPQPDGTLEVGDEIEGSDE